MVIGPIISLDDWVPERPPKNPLLRIPSPDLPPPPPAEHTADNQDAPLPPPPPELLRHMRQLSEPDTKPVTTSRRNSFAGSSSKKPLFRASTFENLLPASAAPPQIPKKPIEMRAAYPTPAQYSQNNNYNYQQQQPQRSVSSLAKHSPTISMKPHKVVMNGKMEAPRTVTAADTRMSLRKRSHNAQLTPLELPPAKHNQQSSSTPPPPLKPRLVQPMIAAEQQRSSSAMGGSSSGGRLR